MNFLFDQSADFRLISHLRERGHDVEAISRNYPPGLADEDVLAIARAERRILVVADRDFGALIFHQRLVHAGVIFFRLPGATLHTKIDHLHSPTTSFVSALSLPPFSVRQLGTVIALLHPGDQHEPVL
jgi:hypothetical protein